MKINPLVMTIRAKKLGVLLRDARQSRGKALDACAQVLGVTSEDIEAYELGEKSPSLPELEALASFLEVPLDHFWGDRALSPGGDGRSQGASQVQAMRLRQRVIGALLRKMRVDAGLSLEALAERVYSAPALLESYELGEAPIPLPDLEALSQALGGSIENFLERSQATPGESQPSFVQDFLELPQELQAFVARPVNRPYLELAQRLSEMDVRKLREVAEGLLAITL
jgi:transcriptional regulator with XRE-family HTH domain